MKLSIRDFFQEVQRLYNYTEGKLDENYNMVIQSVKGTQIVVPYSAIKAYYTGYINSNASKDLMISRAVGYLTNLAKG